MKLFDRVQLREDGPIFRVVGLEGACGQITRIKITHQWYDELEFNMMFKWLGE